MQLQKNILFQFQFKIEYLKKTSIKLTLILLDFKLIYNEKLNMVIFRYVK